MQYKIPQNVGVEDRIVGPLTLRQLIIIAVGVGISYMFFMLANKFYEVNAVEYVIIAMPALLSAAFALIKINDISLLKFLFLFLEFSLKPRRRVWNHRGIVGITSPDLQEEVKKTSAEEAIADKTKKPANLDELSRLLDSGGFEHLPDVEHPDIDAAPDENLVTGAYFGQKKTDDPAENMYWRTRESQMKRLEIMAKKLPVTKIKKTTEVSGDKSSSVSKTPPPQTPPKTPPLESKKTIPPKPVQAKTPAEQKKQRPRRPAPSPARAKHPVDTTQKNQPVSYHPAPPARQKSLQKTPAPSTSLKASKGEFDVRDLEAGEIEIKL